MSAIDKGVNALNCGKTFPPLVIFVIIRFQRVCNKLFKRIFINYYLYTYTGFSKGIKISRKRTYCFSASILSEAAIEGGSMVNNLEKCI